MTDDMSKDIEKMLIDQNHQIKCSLLGLEDRVSDLERYRKKHSRMATHLEELDDQLAIQRLESDEIYELARRQNNTWFVWSIVMYFLGIVAGVSVGMAL